MKDGDLIGRPIIVILFVVSLPLVNMSRHLVRMCWFSCVRYWMGEMSEIDMMILILSSLNLRPMFFVRRMNYVY